METKQLMSVWMSLSTSSQSTEAVSTQAVATQVTLSLNPEPKSTGQGRVEGGRGTKFLAQLSSK